MFCRLSSRSSHHRYTRMYMKRKAERWRSTFFRLKRITSAFRSIFVAERFTSLIHLPPAGSNYPRKGWDYSISLPQTDVCRSPTIFPSLFIENKMINVGLFLERLPAAPRHNMLFTIRMLVLISLKDKSGCFVLVFFFFFKVPQRH